MQAEQMVGFYHFNLLYSSEDFPLPDHPHLSLQLTNPMPQGIELPARMVVWDLVGNLCSVFENACECSI